MKAIIDAFYKEKAQVRTVSVIVKLSRRFVSSSSHTTHLRCAGAFLVCGVFNRHATAPLVQCLTPPPLLRQATDQPRLGPGTGRTESLEPRPPEVPWKWCFLLKGAQGTLLLLQKGKHKGEKLISPLLRTVLFFRAWDCLSIWIIDDITYRN